MSTGTTRPLVHIVPTGTANTASVIAALRRAGADTAPAADATAVRDAEWLVLPGVGALGAAMSTLAGRPGVVETLGARIAAGRPTLCICLGMQMLLEGSAESPGVPGLGALRGTATRFETTPGTDPRVRVPHLGWNSVHPEACGGLLAPGYAYFANSYRLAALSPADAATGWRSAATTHGGGFISAVEKGRVLACQFHPELSGVWGLALISRWLRAEAASPRGALRLAAGLLPRVIPCLDVRDGRVVKGVRFQGLRDAGDPAERAAAYEAQGADELVMLDVSATAEGRRAALGTVRAVRSVLSIPLTVGGGVRAEDDCLALLEAGADKVSLNSAPVRDPAVLTRLASRYGSQCVVLAIDGARAPGAGPPRWQAVIRGGSERVNLDAVEWARRGVALGAGEVLLTSFDQDGTRTGYDLDLLKAVSAAVPVPVIASGGAATPAHMADALAAGADAALAASIFHDGDHTVGDVKRALAGRGVNVRQEPSAC